MYYATIEDVNTDIDEVATDMLRQTGSFAPQKLYDKFKEYFEQERKDGSLEQQLRNLTTMCRLKELYPDIREY